MSWYYAWLNFCSRKWLWELLLFVFITLVLGVIGFRIDGPTRSWWTNAYLAVQLFSLESGYRDHEVPWPLEVARWLAAVVSVMAVIAVVVKLFHQAALTAYVAIFAFTRRLLLLVYRLRQSPRWQSLIRRHVLIKWLTERWSRWQEASSIRRHVIVAGLGERGQRLVCALRKQGENVVVIEANGQHPGIDECRRNGAVVLHANPTERRVLERAWLRDAKSLLALFEDDRDNLQTAMTAFEILQWRKTSADPAANRRPPGHSVVNCVLQVTEPGLVELVLRDEIALRRTDDLRLMVFNAHEVTARAMLRESTLGVRRHEVRRLIMLGTGESNRLGETLILRAAKDWRIEHRGQPVRKLQIDVFEHGARFWLAHLQERYPFLRDVATFRTHNCLPTKCGIGERLRQRPFPQHVDAAFVCLAEEDHAVTQAYVLRQELGADVPVIVRVLDSTAGFGLLLTDENGRELYRNCIPVGIKDRVFDARMATDPKREMLAQAMHEEYLRKTHLDVVAARNRQDKFAAENLLAKDAVWPWNRLKETYRVSSRALAKRVERFLAETDPEKKPCGYKAVYDPAYFAGSDPIEIRDFGGIVEHLAKREHEFWWNERLADGWKHGTTRNDKKKLHPNLIDWEELDDGTKDYDRELVRRIPVVLAKADYRIEVVDGEPKPN